VQNTLKVSLWRSVAHPDSVRLRWEQDVGGQIPPLRPVVSLVIFIKIIDILAQYQVWKIMHIDICVVFQVKIVRQRPMAINKVIFETWYYR
jgi:hypothetical protein